MRVLISPVIAVIGLLALVRSAQAFDTIPEVDHYDEASLLKAGIVVRPFEPDSQEYHPAFEWVEIEFDCNRIPKEHPVAIIARFSANGKRVGAARTERSKAVEGKLSLVVCVPSESVDQSGLEIYMWQPEDGGRSAYGYTLSMKRIVELARNKSKAEPIEKQK